MIVVGSGCLFDVLHCPSWLLAWMLVDVEVQVALGYLWSDLRNVSTPGLGDCILGEEQTLLFNGTGGLEPKGCLCFVFVVCCVCCCLCLCSLLLFSLSLLVSLVDLKGLQTTISVTRCSFQELLLTLGCIRTA